MLFTPYHKFQNRLRLEGLVTELHENGAITPGTHENFQRYHPAFVHKLRSARLNLDRLEEKLTTTEIQEAADTTGDFMFEVNMFIDGFFYNSGSALDILARVVLTLFAQPLPSSVYFLTAHQVLSTNKPGDPILPKIANPTWRKAFSDYRNTLTHELVLAPRYQIDIDGTSGTPSHTIRFPLPDDPRAIPSARTFKRNPNALDYVKQHFKRVLSLGNNVYGDIHQRGTAAGALPL